VFPSDGYEIHKILNIKSRKKRLIINNIFLKQPRESSLIHLYVRGLVEITNIMTIVIDYFYNLINNYIIKRTVADRNNVITIRQRKN